MSQSDSSSDKTCDVCVWVFKTSETMVQSIGDIFGQGYQLITPFLRTVIEVMPGTGGSNGNGKVQKEIAKKSKELGTPKNGKSIVANLPFNRNFVRLAGISGALAVGLGAYGAHVIMIKENIPEGQKHSFRTANMYHFIGTFGLVASSLSRFPILSGALMAIGTTVFCGACYYHGLTGDTSANKFAPFGGTTLIAAWLSLVL